MRLIQQCLKKTAEIEQCFQSVFYACGISLDNTSLQRCRGQDKQAAIAALLGRQGSPERIAQILGLFKTYFKEQLHNLIEHPSFARLVDELHHKGIRVGIGTGLPTELFQELFTHLGWKKYALDYVGISERIGKSRPKPDMIYDMMRMLSIQQANQVLKVGDTIADVQEGQAAGCLTAAVLAGTQDAHTIRSSMPDFLIERLEEVITIVDSF